MLKSLALAVVLLAGTAAAADGVEIQDQIYVVAGVLGGVCLLLTIAAIFTIVTTIKLQTQVAVLKSNAKAIAMDPPPSNLLGGGSGSLLRESRQLETQPQPQPHQRPPQMGLPRTDVTRYSSPPRDEPYRSPTRDDPYRAPTRESRPAPPPRPYRPTPAREYY